MNKFTEELRMQAIISNLKNITFKPIDGMYNKETLLVAHYVLYVIVSGYTLEVIS